MANDAVTSDARIRASLPTIELALSKGAKVLLMSHLGRPDEGEYTEQYSLAPVATHLSKLIGKSVRLVRDYRGQSVELGDGEIVMLENVRFTQCFQLAREQRTRAGNRRKLADTVS